MNQNRIKTEGFSNSESERLYTEHWPDDPETAELCDAGQQCGGCAFYAKFNADYGLCCNSNSRHTLETIFEHFTCAATVQESWGSHSFSGNAENRA